MSDQPTYEEAAFPVQSPRYTAFKIAFFYASISVIWILFSDQLLSILVKDIETITRIQMVKGWFFVFATSYLIFLLLQSNYSPPSEGICPEKAIWMATSGFYPLFAMVCR